MAFKAFHYLLLVYLPDSSQSLFTSDFMFSEYPTTCSPFHPCMSSSMLLYPLLLTTPQLTLTHLSIFRLAYHIYSKSPSLNPIRLNTFLCVLHILCTFQLQSSQRTEICFLHRLQWNLKGRDHPISIFETLAQQRCSKMLTRTFWQCAKKSNPY